MPTVQILAPLSEDEDEVQDGGNKFSLAAPVMRPSPLLLRLHPCIIMILAFHLICRDFEYSLDSDFGVFLWVALLLNDPMLDKCLSDIVGTLLVEPLGGSWTGGDRCQDRKLHFKIYIRVTSWFWLQSQSNQPKLKCWVESHSKMVDDDDVSSKLLWNHHMTQLSVLAWGKKPRQLVPKLTFWLGN